MDIDSHLTAELLADHLRNLRLKKPAGVSKRRCHYCPSVGLRELSKRAIPRIVVHKDTPVPSPVMRRRTYSMPELNSADGVKTTEKATKNVKSHYYPAQHIARLDGYCEMFVNDYY